ncbi:unnamed protein product [Toxocara canis]|uniref:Ion_trans domain-containing protein n=1 Tax=Toxocara canis TaxID=6265 RepID=A0A183U8B6_TOXCA|nr:unnamed protein product [Toxocara canis]
MFSLCACITYIVMGFVEAYYATGAWANNCNDIGSDGFIHNGCRTIYEWAFASVRFFFVTFVRFSYVIQLAISMHDRS